MASEKPPELAKGQPVIRRLLTVSDLQAYAKAKYKADEIQTSCLNTLWTMESHWNPRARNGDAYGIAQALPASKMNVIGKNWKTNPTVQIKWGLWYLKTRYSGHACWALKHELDKGWY